MCVKEFLILHQIIQGDCLEVMKTFPDNHFSAIVTDPPYGLKFMNKEWDYGIPGCNFWTHTLRISRPGAYLLAFGGTRTFHRLACAIEDAGFEIRDTLMWVYGSGFPKSHNKYGIEGYGTALKPAYEPIIMAMKPLDGTFKQNAEKWGQAGINIAATRIGTEKRLNPPANNSDPQLWRMNQGKEGQECEGRWPANILFDEEAAKMLDKQVFENNMRCKTGSGISCRGKQDGSMFQGLGNSQLGKRIDIGDSGGASRFFYCAKTSSRERNEGLEELPDKIGGGMCSTVSGDTRTGHITIQKNNHPTVKPLKLMEYLIKLVMPPKDGLLLDPFAGSGSTILAAKRLGFDAIGIEKSEDYCEIARKRIESYKEQKKIN